MNRDTSSHDLLRQQNRGVIEAPFPADEAKPYAFVSYSHLARNRVFPVMKALYEQGFRLWYDEGLEIGEDYYATLKKHVKECAVFLLMASRESAKSGYINEHEIPQALGFRKPIVVCYLDPGVEFETLALSDFPGGTPEEMPRILSAVDGYSRGERRTARGHQVRVNPVVADREQLYAFEVCPGGVRLTKYRGKESSVEIPAEYPPDTGIRVVELGNVFWNYAPLRRVVIPPTVHTISPGCFQACGDLEDVTVPASLAYMRTDGVRSAFMDQDYSFLPDHQSQKVVMTVHTPPGSPAVRLFRYLSMFEGNPISTHPWTDFSKVRIVTDLEEESPEETEKTAYASYAREAAASVLPILSRLQDQRCRLVCEPVGSESSVSPDYLRAAAFLAFVDRVWLRDGGQELLLQAMRESRPVCIYKLEECELPGDVSALDSVHQLLHNYGSERERAAKLVNWLTEAGCRNEYDVAYFDYSASGGAVRLTGCADAARFVTVPAKIADRKVKKPSLEIFNRRNMLEHISVEEGCPFFSAQDGLLMDKAGKILLLCPRGMQGDVRVPDGIRDVRKEAFAGCGKIRSAVLPEGVRRLGKRCFQGCGRLFSVSLPRSLRKMKKSLFEECASLEEIALPENIRKLPKTAFFECRALREVSFPEGLRTVGSNCFAECASLSGVRLPDSVRKIKVYAFSNTAVRSVSFPRRLRKISLGVFFSCGRLTSVEIPGHVRRIGMSAFRSCAQLRQVILCWGVRWIWTGAFSGCTELRLAEIPPSVRFIAKDAFANCPALAVRCKEGSYAWKYCLKNGIKAEPLP